MHKNIGYERQIIFPFNHIYLSRLPRYPVDKFSYTNAMTSKSIIKRISHGLGLDMIFIQPQTMGDRIYLMNDILLTVCQKTALIQISVFSVLLWWTSHLFPYSSLVIWNKFPYQIKHKFYHSYRNKHDHDISLKRKHLQTASEKYQENKGSY